MRIIEIRSNPKMQRITTRRIVASVQHLQSFRDNPKCQRVGDSRTTVLPVKEITHSVSIFVFSSLPFPALAKIVCIHPTPESQELTHVQFGDDTIGHSHDSRSLQRGCGESLALEPTGARLVYCTTVLKSGE